MRGIGVSLLVLLSTQRAVVAVRMGRRAAALAPLTAAAAPRPAFAAKSRTDGYEVQQTDSEWRRTLSEYEYFILREGGTEPPNSSPLVTEKRSGTFRCSACDEPLFDASQKFNSGTGWPSFAKPIGNAVEEIQKGALQRVLLGTEVRCAKCGGHLGDVFADGLLFPGTPAALTGNRFCIDGTALAFEPAGTAAGERVRVSGEPQRAQTPADVALPEWLQPPKISSRGPTV